MIKIEWENLSEDVKRRNPQLKELLRGKATKEPQRQIISTVTWDASRTVDGCWIQIPEIIPSLNEWKVWHWSKQHKYKQYLYEQITLLAKVYKLPKIKFAKVLITYYFPTNRRRDMIDNYAPKFIMDALVRGGILKDDRSDWVDVPRPVDKRDMERPRVEIEIRAV